MVSGAFISFAVIRFGPETFRTEIVNTPERKSTLGRWWVFTIKYLIPVQVVTLLVWWMYLSAAVYAPDTWYNPLSPFSVATVLVQWSVAMSLFYFFNKKIAAKTVMN